MQGLKTFDSVCLPDDRPLDENSPDGSRPRTRNTMSKHSTTVRVDLRSDTVTQPTRAMREAMMEAVVGDDVLGDDPTVAALEARVAELLGKEAALYVPSGTMSNLIGVRLNCKPGDEMICEAQCHIIYYEQGCYAQLSGVAARCVEGEFGVLEP